MKNRIFGIVLIGFLITNCLFSQEEKSQSDTSVYIIAETMPRFLTSQDTIDFLNFRMFFMSQFRYPDTEIDYCCKISFHFIVEPDSTISSLQFLRDTPIEFKNEVSRVMNLISKTYPALISGKPVRLKFPMMINISLQ